MNDPFSCQSLVGNQLPLDTVEFACPSCLETPEATEESGSTMTLRPCGHAFQRSDLAGIIDYLCTLDGLIQRHDAATTPFERQGIQEEIHAVGTKLDTIIEQCNTLRSSPRAL
jgi:hypothetical protein